MKRREFLSCLGLGVLAATIIAFCVVVFYAVLPRETRLPLGPQTAFLPDQPVHLALDSRTDVFVVNLDGQLIAWDANSPVTGFTRCYYKWVPTNHRFEDPCSGDKWCLDGAVADNRITPARTLDRYKLDVDGDGSVWLHPDQIISGTPFPDTVSRQCPGAEQSQ